jgi:hypothetical protein
LKNCGPALFTVSPSLPEKYRKGVFEKSDPMQATVRFSNAPGAVQRDCMPTARGLSLKLLPYQQNFTFVDAPLFPFSSLEVFTQFVQSLSKGPLNLVPFMASHPEIAWLFVSQLKLVSEELYHLQYFTVGSISLGQFAAKLHARPVFPEKFLEIKNSGQRLEESKKSGLSYFLDPNFLGSRLRSHLALQPVRYTFDLEVLEESSQNQSMLDDLSQPWPQKNVVLVQNCASLNLGAQSQQANLDDLSYSPWEGQPLHVPLGAIMRARQEIYSRAKELRSQMRG